ncbi:MAG: hypothetical protein HRT74_13275 [Flavobacteriales bacterium]|nr:hypothetical protein [Flavobacteriales bacterium]
MKKLLTLTLIFLSVLTIQTQAQDQVYLDQTLNVSKKKDAQFTRTMTYLGDSVYVARVTDLEGNLKVQGAYTMMDGKLYEHGKFTYYYTNGQIESQGMYEMGIKVGSWKRFTSSGDPKPDRYYRPESADLIRAVME